MQRTTFRMAGLAVILSAWLCQSAQAQQRSTVSAPRRTTRLPGEVRARRFLSNRLISHVAGTRQKQAPGRLQHNDGARPVRFADRRMNLGRTGAGPQQVNPGYPYLNASMYPSPQPNIPYLVGSTVITNQAFAPHEMMHPHTYRAMYPPFFYKVSGGWMVTPWGVWSRDKWELQGTKVEVKYHSRVSIFARLFR